MGVGTMTELSEGGMGGGNSYFQETLDPGIDGVIAPPRMPLIPAHPAMFVDTIIRTGWSLYFAVGRG